MCEIQARVIFSVTLPIGRNRVSFWWLARSSRRAHTHTINSNFNQHQPTLYFRPLEVSLRARSGASNRMNENADCAGQKQRQKQARERERVLTKRTARRLIGCKQSQSASPFIQPDGRLSFCVTRQRPSANSNMAVRTLIQLCISGQRRPTHPLTHPHRQSLVDSDHRALLSLSPLLLLLLSLSLSSEQMGAIRPQMSLSISNYRRLVVLIRPEVRRHCHRRRRRRPENIIRFEQSAAKLRNKASASFMHHSSILHRIWRIWCAAKSSLAAIVLTFVKRSLALFLFLFLSL